MTGTGQLGKLMTVTAAVACTSLALAGAGWLLAGPTGLLAAGIVGAVAALPVIRALHVPATARPPQPAHADVPFEDAPYVRYRKLFSGLSWGQVSARQFDHATRPHLERITAAVLRARCGVDPAADPDAAGELLGAELWALADPDRPRSDDSDAPAVALRDVTRLVGRLEEL